VIHYLDATDAINAASGAAPCCIGYKRGKGWFIYNATEACPVDARPEFFMPKQGIIPIPLSEIAAQTWLSVVNDALQAVASQRAACNSHVSKQSGRNREAH
jgi:hypothetical protein